MEVNGVSVVVSPFFQGQLREMFVGKFILTSLFFGAIVGAYMLAQKYPIAAAAIYPAWIFVLAGIAMMQEKLCESFLEERINLIARGNFVALGEVAVILSKLKPRIIAVGVMCGLVVGGFCWYLALKFPTTWEVPNYGNYKIDEVFLWIIRSVLALLGIFIFIYLSLPKKVSSWLSSTVMVLQEGDSGSASMYQLADEMKSQDLTSYLMKGWNLHVNWTLIGYCLFGIWAFFAYVHRFGELVQST